jgi:hypothetical protein
MANAMAKGKPNSRFVCYYIIYIAKRKTREGNIIFGQPYIKRKPAVGYISIYSYAIDVGQHVYQYIS